MSEPPKNDRLLRAVRGEKVDRTPVWMMRQAGRYLPEFRDLRKKHSFMEICQTPKLACEATLQPVRRFDVDAAVVFCDVLVVPQAMGLTVETLPNSGPFFPDPLSDPKDMSRLRTPVVANELKYVFETIQLVRRELEGNMPVISFSGAPWTLMSYMIEGASSKTMSKAKRWLYVSPRESHDLLGRISDTVIEFMTGQAKYGAQFLQLVDTNVRFLNPNLFAEFVVPYVKRIREKVKENLASEGLQEVPMAFFPNGAHFALEQVRGLGFEVVALDAGIPAKVARNSLGPDLTLQGNLDPCALYAPSPRLTTYVKTMLEDFGVGRHIATLGDSLFPDVEPAKVAHFVKTVHLESARMRAKEIFQ